ncbi:MAG: phage tail tape measure protein [Rhodoferax sp.]|nr:phage tail tape measure protein [Rhodoferax sp.]
MSTTYVVGVRIDGNAGGYLRATQQAQAATRSFTGAMRAEFQRLKSFMQTTQGQLGSLGLGVGLVQVQKNAAELEKKLTQVRLTAGMTAAEQNEAYRTMFDLIKKNGGAIDDTVAGYNNLIQAGLKYKEAIEATKAVSLGRAVTGASEEALSGSLTVGAANYGFDLAQAGTATRMLDQMTVAGRLGNAELENLSSIFPRVAQRAQSAGMGFEKTLAFIEGLSQIERQPERLATLADSTLRLFTNANYAKDAESATGVQFFDKGGARRDPVAILEDMRKGYAKLTTDAQRFQYVSKAFGKADLDTQRGVQSLLGSNSLQDMRSFEAQIKNAGGTLERDLPIAVANAADQASRLKNTLRQAAEEFARPVNDAVANAIKHLLNSKEQGGLGLSGGQIMGGAAVVAAGTYAAARFLPGILGKVAGRAGGLAAGVAEGKALQSAAGVTPVYVTNWAEMSSGGGGALDALGGAATGAAAVGMAAKLRGMLGVAALMGNAPLGVLAGAGAGGLATVAGGVGLAGAAGYGVGTGIYKLGLEGNRGGEAIGAAVAKVLALFGNEEAQRSLAVNEALKNTRVGGEMTIRVTGAPGLAVTTETKPFAGTRLTALGQTNMGAGQ